ncbi:MAG TPA: alpha-amylase family protein [Thermoanaerobaculia bacterium]|nr:alpha-amylase family protein [Thermoanaerobaculia bacterium]
MRDLWYKEAIVYCLDVETFQDSDGDGVGDFNGLTERLDYLLGLGVTALWLLPFYPTPNRDNGYDVTDYYTVDPRLGTLGDFVEFMERAARRGLQVLIDLPVNHTSSEHPWFQQARRDPESRYHDYYVWSEEEPEEDPEELAFAGVQESLWTWDEEAELYYFHRFYEHQPDVNIANPQVREEIRRIMGFWLELGVSGFRIDAAPFLIELKGIDAPDVDDPYDYLHEFRDFLSWRRGDAILIAEANVAPETAREYFGDGDRMHVIFDFVLNQALFLALASERAEPMVRAFGTSEDLPAEAQWANFVRNHDEQNLNQLSEEERAFVMERFAPDEDMRLYGHGIRRRLPPMLEGDPRRIRLAYSLMFSLPGTPVLRYGEELGMGDDLSLPERNSVRTVMQWSDEKNAGFSRAEPEALARPAIEDGEYGYRQLNVLAQRRDPESLLNWMERLIRIRRESHELGWGTGRVLDTGHPAVFAHVCCWDHRVFVGVHNLGEEAATVHLDLSDWPEHRLLDLLGDRPYEVCERGEEHFTVELDGYGYRWLRLSERAF